ncbi:hypothetical protein IG631_08050 [Alternaria alternata]|nr:hypothetical protein IG631_08050 [Alternaria alternata]
MDARTTAQPVCFNNQGGKIAIQAAEYHSCSHHAKDAVLRVLPYAAEAPFATYSKQHEPTCLPHTRTALLDEIYKWTDGQDERCVYWLNGLAGTGKSTVARTVAREWYERKRLGASFFFAKGGGDVSHAGKFVTSIAVQLARSISATYEHICGAVENKPDISSLPLQDQWKHLIHDPLSKLFDSGDTTPIVLVIDALDECEDDENIRTIINLLTTARGLSRPRLRIFLTSRPEIAVRHTFSEIPDASHQSCILHHIARSTVDADIELFLEHKLGLIGREYHLFRGWPGPEIVAQMVRRASGLFIWASTALRFIQQGRRFAARRIDLIIKGDNDTQAEPEKHLDDIYITVLQNSLYPEYTEEEKDEHCKTLRLVLGSLVVLRSPLAAKYLAVLLDMAEEDIRSIVEDLHAILDISADGSRPLRLHHPSLRDFLLTRSRSVAAKFWIDEAHMHRALALRCLILKTRFNRQRQEEYQELVSKGYANLTKKDRAQFGLTTIKRPWKHMIDGFYENEKSPNEEPEVPATSSRFIEFEYAYQESTMEAQPSPDFLYARSNLAYHASRSGKLTHEYSSSSLPGSLYTSGTVLSLEHKLAFTFLSEHIDDWKRLYDYWDLFDTWEAGIICLKDRFPVGLPCSIQAQGLITYRNTKLPSCTLSPTKGV